MEWRCKWCGKPHEEDDPPCDNCGHSSFERAVEQVNTDTVPREHIWVCPECGREHQKHSPPCSRCGNVELERRRPDYSDLEDLGGTSYRDVFETKYVLAYIVVGIVGLVFVLGLAGVVTLPGQAPSVPDAPGESAVYGNVSLSETEAALVAGINEERQASGEEAVESGSTLSRMAAYYNKQRVRALYAGGERPRPSDLQEFGPNCRGDVTLRPLQGVQVGALTDTGNVPESAEAFADGLLAYAAEQGVEPAAADERRVGVDVHVANDRAYLTLVTC